MNAILHILGLFLLFLSSQAQDNCILVKCGSHGGEFRECKVPTDRTIADIYKEKEAKPYNCRGRNENWGFMNDYIWVVEQCRAHFRVCYSGSSSIPSSGGSSQFGAQTQTPPLPPGVGQQIQRIIDSMKF
ncbi:hypothetical protein ACJMK2_024733 [Sinanodonta woodiana]|uniref:Uncharacterized protein n=1 Tax=Sinanodonta woodiana TaxID=1069815 RepID=A0ABD3XG85_SINWO